MMELLHSPQDCEASRRVREHTANAIFWHQDGSFTGQTTGGILGVCTSLVGVVSIPEVGSGIPLCYTVAYLAELMVFRVV